MAKKIYGDRWEIVTNIAEGGQGEVFRVKDKLGEFLDDLALKRVLNPKRHDRFRSEIEATKRLNHPNVVKLIDHSALSDDGQIPDKQFLVMPLADGDLSKRAGLYKDSVDSVTRVARQLAGALKAAHAAGIIHRDVKPQNILFPKAGEHDAWLSDFGICLIRDIDRATNPHERVGPAHFMAPELESGGRLEVMPYVDIYSLGKVIYYMLSGGIVMPREDWHDDEYAAIFKRGGERQQLFQVLLARMITPLKNRLQYMDEVIAQLNRIENWASDASLLPVSQGFLSNWRALEQGALQARQAAEEKADAAARRQAHLAATQQGVLMWLQNQIESAVSLLQGGLITVGIRKDTRHVPMVGNFRPQAGIEVWARLSTDTFKREHILRFSFCTEFRNNYGGVTPPEHSNVGVLPTYAHWAPNGQPKQEPGWYYLTPQNGIQAIPTPNPLQAAMRNNRRALFPQQQQQPMQAQFLNFQTSQWPEVSQALADFFERAMDTFSTVLQRGGSNFPF